LRGRFRRTKRLLFYGAVRLLQLLAVGLPRGAALAVFAGIADVVRGIDRPAVRRSLAHLEIAARIAPDAGRRRAVVREMFRGTARNLVDLFRLGNGRTRRAVVGSVRFEGLEHLDAALARGRGVVLLSAHLGNWEVLAAALAARGYPLSVIVQDLFDRRSDRLLNRWRRASGVGVVRRQGGLLRAARVLREGGILGTLVDQDAGGPAVFVPFFGRPARTPVGPFRLGRRVGAELVPAWIAMDESGVHRATVRPALPAPGSADPEEAVRADVERWHAILEEAIGAHPGQWVWHHRRWKTPPPAAAHFRNTSSEEPYLDSFQRSRKVSVAR
jgi:KDO2-lipid IV(A) lauroyltransferase